MSEIVIKAENLSKQYRLGVIGTGTLTHDLQSWWARVRGHEDPNKKITHGSVRKNQTEKTDDEHIWALKDVSFEVKQGEVLGIIGRNGAGKSTLLKILSRVTAPTSGSVKIKGRVASLLEVGTGFHPELTGRENIYLNGAILGMKRSETDQKFDEIVAFAEIEKFINTPVKRYSSGMYVRLAFAVAAHLEPEILLVDEVLAVGDADFQKKCLGKMGDVAKSGRTILFVSHNIGAVSKLCNNAVILKQGTMTSYQSVQKAISDYMLSKSKNTAQIKWEIDRDAPGDDYAKLRSVRLIQNNHLAEIIEIEKPFIIEVIYINNTERMKITATVQLVNSEGICIFFSNDWNNKEWWNTPRKKGIICAKCKIPGNLLAEGRYFVTISLGSYNPNVEHAAAREILNFDIIDNNIGESVRGYYTGKNWPGIVRPLLEWEINYE